jgi:hypothetical protein
MTFQTTPYMPWVFPDEAYEMNRNGKSFLDSSPFENLSADVGTESPWASHERQVAMDRVKNTKTAKLGMEGKINTTARSQREYLPASRSAVPNGVFHGSPMDYYTSGNAFRGGRIYTKEGQEWLAKRLKERAGEYEAISSGNFSAGPPQQIQISPYTGVDTLLSNIFTAFSTGSFTSSVSTALTQLLGEFIKIGSIVTPSQLTNYAQAIQKLIETTRPFTGRPDLGEIMGPVYESKEKRLRFIDQINQTLKLIEAVIKEIARTINEPLSARQQVVSILQQRLLGAQIEQYRPSFAGEERVEAVEAVPSEIPMGGPSRGPLLGINQGFAGPPLAMNEAEAYAGQGRRRGRPRKY